MDSKLHIGKLFVMQDINLHIFAKIVFDYLLELGAIYFLTGCAVCDS